MLEVLMLAALTVPPPQWVEALTVHCEYCSTEDQYRYETDLRYIYAAETN